MVTRNQKIGIIAGAIGLVLVIAGVVLAIILTQKSSAGSTPAPTPAPTPSGPIPVPAQAPANSMIYVEDADKMTYDPSKQSWPSPEGVCPSNMPYGLITPLCGEGSNPAMVNGGRMKCTDKNQGWFSGCVQASKMYVPQ